MNRIKSVVGICILGILGCLASYTADAQTAPPLNDEFKTIGVLFPGGLLNADAFYKTVRVTNSNQHVQICPLLAVYLPTNRMTWSGISVEKSHFILLNNQIVQVPPEARSIMRLRCSGKQVADGEDSQSVLRKEMSILQSNLPEPRFPVEFRVNLITILGEDALWDVGPVFAADGKTEIGRKTKNATASPRAKVENVSFESGNLVFSIVGEHAVKSTITLSPDVRPIMATKVGFRLPRIPTNCVFRIDKSGMHPVQ